MAEKSVPVVMYHSICESPPRDTRALSVTPAAFAAQLNYLQTHGYTGMTFGDFCARRRTGAEMPNRPIVLTFDDGYSDTLHEALPTLVRYGFPATVFVTSGWVRDSSHSSASAPPARMMSWAEIADLDSVGIEIGAHSHSHAELDQIPTRSLRTELGLSRDLLEDFLGRPVVSFAFPYGYTSDRVREVTRETGYLQAAAVANRAATTAGDAYGIPRLTIRRSTSPKAFSRIVEQQHLAMQYAGAHALTAAWAQIRRLRRATRSAIGDVATTPHTAMEGL